MSNEQAFSYTYSAKENQEVLDIRKKYLPREETKLEELKRLDELVQSSGIVEGLSAGIGGTMLLGLGMCLAMEVIGNAIWLGVILGLIGIAGMIGAFPIYRKFFRKAKAQHINRILQLTEELTSEL